MHNLDWLQYRRRLLAAGLGYRWVMRHVGELQDHFDDLWQQARQDGKDAVVATDDAMRKLGSLPVLAENVIATVRPCLLHRRPLLLTTLLPAFSYLLFSALALLIAAGLATLARNAIAAGYLAADFQLVELVNAVIVVQMYLVLPLCVLTLMCISLRNHSRRRYWVSGLLLLLIVGSALRLHVGLGDPTVPNSSSVGFFLGFSFSGYVRGYPVGSNEIRLVANFLIAGLGLCYAFVRQRSARNSGGKEPGYEIRC